jgi:hypothetical protein
MLHPTSQCLSLPSEERREVGNRHKTAEVQIGQKCFDDSKSDVWMFHPYS